MNLTMEASENQRSRTMRAIKSTGTMPERVVRQILTRMGVRYRLHRADLPGKPDLAFIGRRKVIFVHGCFWHGHDCKRGARAPKENRDYWTKKIAGNRARDARHAGALAAMGWAALTVWECELKDTTALETRLRAFLG